MKENVLGTVRALVRVAAEASNIDEARNAALQACRLIHKHNLLEEEGRAAVAVPEERRPSDDFITEDGELINLDGLFDIFFGNEAPTRRGGTRSRYRGQEAYAAPPPPTPTPKRAPDPLAKQIPVLDFGVKCSICSQRILRGRFAMWSRGKLYHTQCWKNETE